MVGIQIGHLRLNVPGLTREEADRLGQEVMERLKRCLPDNPSPRRLFSMNIKVHIPQQTAKNRMADLIAEQLAKGLL